MAAKRNEPGPEIRTGSSPEHEEELALVARLVAGDAGAFRLLVERHLPAVVATARRMLDDGSEAEDIAQETMLRLWRGASGVEIGPAGLRPWLRRVAVNLSLDRLRARRRVDVVDEVPDEAAEPEQERALEGKEVSLRVRSALAGLPERQRQALTLFHYEGLSQIEIAQVMGISDEAVESLLARARRALKSGLDKEWRGLIASDA